MTSHQTPSYTSQHNILIVDDDIIITTLLKKMVIKAGFDSSPITFLDGTEAIQYLSNNTPPPKTIIFLDINMPNTGAWDFLDTLEKFSFAKNLSIVIITSSISQHDQKKAEKYYQVVDYIIKPVTLKHLVSLKEKLD